MGGCFYMIKELFWKYVKKFWWDIHIIYQLMENHMPYSCMWHSFCLGVWGRKFCWRDNFALTKWQNSKIYNNFPFHSMYQCVNMCFYYKSCHITWESLSFFVLSMQTVGVGNCTSIRTMHRTKKLYPGEKFCMSTVSSINLRLSCLWKTL